MRSQRRLRLYVAVVVVVLLAFTYFTTDAGGGIQNHRFYKKTVTAMNNAHDATVKKNNDAKDRSHIQRLDFDNNNNNNNGARKTSTANVVNDEDKQQEKVIGASILDDSDEISVAGRTKMSVPKAKEEQIQLSDKKQDTPEKPIKVETGNEIASEHEHETPEVDKEEREANAELDSILKRAPIIVFSKSYCPYSMKAKSILRQYSIIPAPYIVELDKHPLGTYLQKLVGTVTGRRTVPNVMINGLSIGGGDDIAALDRDDSLISKIKSVGGKSIMEVERLPTTEDETHSHEM